MFGGKQSSTTKPAQAAPGGGAGLNSLVKGTHIEGKIKAPSDIRIEGTLDGDLDCQAKVIIGPSGVITGTVSCRTAMIEGKFDGTLRVTELLEVREAARVEGDVTYGKIKIDAGAVLVGNIQMTGGSVKAKANDKASAVA
jgi:cytoskeletal protein CcmA (bactofilin family)